MILQYQNTRTERLSCIRSPDSLQSSSSNMFGSLMASMMSSNLRYNPLAPSQTLIVLLLKLCSRLIQSTEPAAPARPSSTSSSSSPPRASEIPPAATLQPPRMSACDYEVASLTDENKAAAAVAGQQPTPAGEAMEQDHEFVGHAPASDEQQSNAAVPDVDSPKVADNVLQHQPTMLRLLTTLATSDGASIAMVLASFNADNADYDDYEYEDDIYMDHSAASTTTAASRSPWNQPVTYKDSTTVTDAVYEMLMLLGKRASSPRLMIAPLYEFIKSSEYWMETENIVFSTCSWIEIYISERWKVENLWYIFLISTL